VSVDGVGEIAVEHIECIRADIHGQRHRQGGQRVARALAAPRRQ
jgi:hypothetical protein